jgi:hypothetical protein
VTFWYLRRKTRRFSESKPGLFKLAGLHCGVPSAEGRIGAFEGIGLLPVWRLRG